MSHLQTPNLKTHSKQQNNTTTFDGDGESQASAFVCFFKIPVGEPLIGLTGDGLLLLDVHEMTRTEGLVLELLIHFNDLNRRARLGDEYRTVCLERETRERDKPGLRHLDVELQ